MENARITDAFGTRDDRKHAMVFCVSEDDQIYVGQGFVYPEEERCGAKIFCVEVRVPIGKDKLPMDAKPFSFDLGNENAMAIGWSFADKDGKGSVLLPDGLYLTYEEAENAIKTGTAHKFDFNRT